MKEEKLIARLTLRNEEMKDELEVRIEMARTIVTRLTAIGAPFNDNVLNFNKDQLKYLRDILNW